MDLHFWRRDAVYARGLMVKAALARYYAVHANIFNVGLVVFLVSEIYIYIYKRTGRTKVVKSQTKMIHSFGHDTV